MIKEQCGVLIKSRHDIVMACINLLESNLYKQKKQFLLSLDGCLILAAGIIETIVLLLYTKETLKIYVANNCYYIYLQILKIYCSFHDDTSVCSELFLY